MADKTVTIRPRGGDYTTLQNEAVELIRKIVELEDYDNFSNASHLEEAIALVLAYKHG